MKTAATIYKKIQDGVFDVSNEVSFLFVCLPTHKISHYYSFQSLGLEKAGFPHDFFVCLPTLSLSGQICVLSFLIPLPLLRHAYKIYRPLAWCTFMKHGRKN